MAVNIPLFCSKVSPADTAIEWDPERVETRETLLARWEKLHPGKAPVLFDNER